MSTQTPLWLSHNTPRKKKLRAKIRSLKRRRLESVATEEVIDLETFFEQSCDSTFTQSMANFIKSEYKLTKSLSKGARYTNEHKQFALTIFFWDQKYIAFLAILFIYHWYLHYKILQKNGIWTAGQNEFVFSVIKSKLKILTKKHACVLCVLMKYL